MSRRAPGEHRDPVAPVQIPVDRMPLPGPIAIEPLPEPAYSEAVVAAGGLIAPLSDATRGLIWHGNGADLASVLDAHPGIGWVQLHLAGVEKCAEAFAGHPDLVWTSAKGSFAEPVAEHALALTLAVLRQLPEKARSSSWAPVRQGISLYGRNVVIIGAGGIAIELMRLLAPFDVSVTIVRRTTTPLPGADRTVAAEQLLEVLPAADVVIVAAAATDETAQLIGAAELAAMKPTAALVNIARGRLVDTDALVAALKSGHLWGAGLDVTDPEPLPAEHPLWAAPRSVITSHSADTQEMVVPLMAVRIRANVAAFLGGNGFVGLVDTKAGY